MNSHKNARLTVYGREVLVEMAIWQRRGGWSVILHSDRGSQFLSGDYQRLLKRHTLICSMSAVGHGVATIDDLTDRLVLKFGGISLTAHITSSYAQS